MGPASQLPTRIFTHSPSPPPALPPPRQTRTLADVLGITNYLDIGFQMVSDMKQADQSVLRIGASWQVRMLIPKGVGSAWLTLRRWAATGT